MKYTILFLSIFLMTGFSAHALEVTVPVNQAKLEINGAVCAYCAYGVQKSLSKKPWIDKSQGHKGVESDIENQVITVYLKEGQSMNLQEAYQAIKKGGYEPRTFHLRMQGNVSNEVERVISKGYAGVLDVNRAVKYMEGSYGKIFLRGEKAAQLKNNQSYDLQLTVGEDDIKRLIEDSIVIAKVHTIIGE